MKSFEEFWPHYVAEHSQPATRTLHAIGTGVGLACAVALAARGKWKWLPVAFVPGYGAAWLSHFLIERNKPATFEHPLWSFMGDYKMIGLMLTGRMYQEIDRLGIEAKAAAGHNTTEAQP
ncbi:MAG TPA: DUF962 domain-containing protein [Pyrinomonadaceae bacterium]|jgi:hypothetical protein